MPLSGYYHNELERVDKASRRLREVMDGLSSAFFISIAVKPRVFRPRPH